MCQFFFVENKKLYLKTEKGEEVAPMDLQSVIALFKDAFLIQLR